MLNSIEPRKSIFSFAAGALALLLFPPLLTFLSRDRYSSSFFCRSFHLWRGTGVTSVSLLLTFLSHDKCEKLPFFFFLFSSFFCRSFHLRVSHDRFPPSSSPPSFLLLPFFCLFFHLRRRYFRFLSC